jgi:prophage antirepressor-like protein
MKMNELTVFNNEEFGEIRTITIDGEPWFVAADVCRALEIGNPTDATHRLDADEKMITLVSIEGNRRGNPNMTVVNEPGLYTLILSSRKPEAKAFKRWITHDIIPTIRKTGGYVNDAAQFIDSYFGQLDSAQKHALTMIFNESKRMTAQLKEQAPKVDFYDTFVSPNKCTGLRDTAKELGISERKFVNFLIDEKYLYRTPAKQLRPYAKKSNEGLFETKDWYTKSDIVSVRVFFTPQGKQFFYEKLIEKGLIGAPMVCA